VVCLQVVTGWGPREQGGDGDIGRSRLPSRIRHGRSSTCDGVMKAEMRASLLRRKSPPRWSQHGRSASDVPGCGRLEDAHKLGAMTDD